MHVPGGLPIRLDMEVRFIPMASAGSSNYPMGMASVSRANPIACPSEWARRCRIEAVRAIHPATKAFLLELAAGLEAAAGEAVDLDPDDSELQKAIADRLSELAFRSGPLPR